MTRRIDRRHWDRQGNLLMDPKAFYGLYDPVGPTEVQTTGDVAIVTVRGPLDKHACIWWDSYEAIADRVESACESAASTIVMRIDSPGGVVEGCFDAARKVRAMCAKAGKRLIAFVDGRASSAAYAFACAAERIIVPETSSVGSIGVINTRIDVTAYNQKDGFAFLITSSGARKADGNPNVAISAEEAEAIRRDVDTLAGKFFAIVEELRGVSAQSIAGLEAATMLGEAAVGAGLADAVMTFDELLEAIEGGSSLTTNKENPMATKYEDAVAALKGIAEDETKPDEAKKAKAALAAMDPEEEKDDDSAEGDDEETDAEDEKKPEDAEGDDEEKKDDEAKAAASGAQARGTRGSTQASATDARLAELERGERARLLSSVTEDQRKRWAKKPLGMLRELVSEFARKPAPLAASAQARGTQGSGEGGRAATSADGVTQMSAEASGMDRLFGLSSAKRGVVNDGTLQTIGGYLPPSAGGAPAEKGA